MLFCFPGERQKRCVLLLEVLLLFCARMQADASRRPSPPLFLEVAAPTASSRRTREKRAIVVVFFFFFFWRKKKQKHVLIFFLFLGFHINPKRSKTRKTGTFLLSTTSTKRRFAPPSSPTAFEATTAFTHIYIYIEREREKRENRDVCNHHHRCCSCCYY